MDARRIDVELVDAAGRTVGIAEKIEAHQPPGMQHRAFSLFALDDSGRLILQRRAQSKYHSPGLLTNTVCGHPLPGEEPREAVRRRTADELRAEVVACEEVAVVRYHVVDEASGLHEYEHNHVFVGRISAEAWNLDPDEVSEVVVVTESELRDRQASEPFTAWFALVFDAARPALINRGFAAAHESVGAE